MATGFVFARDIIPYAQRIFPFWIDKPIQVFLSDLLFIEAAVFLIFGALLAGVVLYDAWAALDVRKVQFTEYIWNWKKMKEERNSSSGLLVGLTILAVGIIYVLVAIAVSFGIVPTL
jgi:ABC-type phosphate transport system permease subunit